VLGLLIYTAVRGRNRGQKINCILQVLFMAAQKQRMERTAGELGTRGAQLQRTEFTMCQIITCIQYIYKILQVLFNRINFLMMVRNPKYNIFVTLKLHVKNVTQVAYVKLIQRINLIQRIKKRIILYYLFYFLSES